MLDRSKCEKMLVWDAGENNAKERIVIDISNNGTCRSVMRGCEDDFLAGDEYRTTYWLHFKHIHQKKTRTMTNDEMREFMLNDTMIEIRHADWPKNGWYFFPLHYRDELIKNWKVEDADVRNWLYRTLSLTGETGEPQKFEYPVEVEE